MLYHTGNEEQLCS